MWAPWPCGRPHEGTCGCGRSPRRGCPGHKSENLRLLQELYMTDSEPHNRWSLGPTVLNSQPGKAAQPEMKNCPQHLSTEQTPGSEAFRVGPLGTQLFGWFGFHTSSSGPGGTFISSPSAQKWAGRLRVGHSHMLPEASGTPRCLTPEAPGTPREWSRKPSRGGLTLGVQTGNKMHVFKH